MGSGTSKDPSPAASGPRRPRSRAFGAACFGLSSSLPHDPDHDDDGEGKTGGCKGGGIRGTDGVEIKSSGEISEGSRRRRKVPPLSANADRDGAHQESSSSSDASSAISSNPSSRSRSRFGFIPDRIGSRLSRAISLGSSRAQSLFPETTCDDVDDGNENEENAVDAAGNDATADRSSHRNHVEPVNNEIRRYNHSQLEGSVRFSRTLSVGRLRDRVLRRSSSTALTLGPALVEHGYAAEYNARVGDRQGLGGRRRLLPYDIGSFTENGYDSENVSLNLREGNGHDLLEHRSAFLERRRRIRSQVRALQRLGSRFENLSGHERSCILSGQHRTGRCACRAAARVAANPNEEAGTRASLSRIVMLAEALFEVLDEIHQQSVALTSRPSFSSIGSVPAPKEVVECMPVKVYMKPQKHHHDEIAQCYICLVEYEDGDFMRILPCNHEFHQKCIDKWLKEIHRVCPLCRGDVCRTEVSGTDKIR